MKQLGTALLLLLLVMPAVAKANPGVKPRAKAVDYPAVQKSDDLTIGAALLSARQVRRTFVSNIGNDYVVIEVGVFPAKAINISANEFVLRIAGTKDIVRPAKPETMAAAIDQKDQKGRDVDVYPVMGVEYSSGPDPADLNCRAVTGAANDSRCRKGWSTTSGVAVDVKDRTKTAKTSAADQMAMTAELSEKGFPEATASKPVAGYLFFQVPAGRNVSYQLEYQGEDKTSIVIPLSTVAE